MECLYVAGTTAECLLRRGVPVQEVSAKRVISLQLLKLSEDAADALP